MVPIIQPFAKLANSILPIDSNGILVLRDNAENVKRMLQMIDRVDVSVPAEYISEVIPIKYALADDIASALNSLGGTGGGSCQHRQLAVQNHQRRQWIWRRRDGCSRRSRRLSRRQWLEQRQPAAPLWRRSNRQRHARRALRFSSGCNPSFKSRRCRWQQDQIQVFGQTKIIADERSNSLLVFATRQDMETIKNIIAKLDVLLSQVLIESVIMEVSLDKTLNTGVSARPKSERHQHTQLQRRGRSYQRPVILQFSDQWHGRPLEIERRGNQSGRRLQLFRRHRELRL